MNQVRILSWLRQPTTLQGGALLIGSIAGAHFGLNEGLADTLALSAIPLLIPDNTTAQHEASLVATAAVHALAKEKSPQPAVSIAAEAVRATDGKVPT